ncbi:MAG: phosphoenolpyruvate synthase [Desulfomonile tiedjei]|uniref:Phosphoenolpyruvate synthase n=1 Tax=Desulfomonile tiedjei TaxID=2358 RepID=A0A9D6Z5I1_9BACT|nr:phosphoenolpyruvate synthase [Desulfomonile tiedjei]
MKQVFSNIYRTIRRWRTGNAEASREKLSRLFRFRYACFKDLLSANTELLNIITDFEQKLRGQDVFGMSYVRSQATRAVFHTLKMVKSLDDLSGHHYGLLFEIVEKINLAINEELGKRKELPVSDWVLPYSGITREMVDWVGGKNANLGELRNRVGLPIPEGFAITTRAYELFLERNDLIDEINRYRMDLDPNDPGALNQVSEHIQRLMITAKIPAELEKAIMNGYAAMRESICKTRGYLLDPKVALRSSAIGEDSELSYAGQYLSILNVPADKILDTYKLVIASIYSPRAISYRLNKGMRDEDIAMSVACIEMVESTSSGVIFSRDPLHPLEDNVLINAVWGLGPYAVDGVITPDSYIVAKDKDLTIREIRISHKPVQLVAEPEIGLKEIPVESGNQDKACLTNEQAQTLAKHAVGLEKHYQYPQDVEWAIDPHGRILILQTRPLHLENLQKEGVTSIPLVEGYPVVLEGGSAAFPGIGFGPVFLVESDEDLLNFPDGAVLVANHSSPEFVVVMTKAAAIVTDAGSVTGHMASLAREFGVPTLLGTKDASAKLVSGSEVTVDAYSGRVYLGKVTELTGLSITRESAMKDTPVYQTLRRIADWIIPLHLVNPRSHNFRPEHCKTIHDVMRLVHELSYKEMFSISDAVSNTEGAGALKLRAPIPLDLHIIDLGGGILETPEYSNWVDVDNIASLPFKALLRGMLHKDLRAQGPRPIDVGGFFSVFREQMLAPNNMAERFGDRSYAIISDAYLNFSSRIGYHYSILDSYCCETINKNYITFSFKGGAADDVRRNRRARAIAAIFEALCFQVEVREDRVDARFYKYEMEAILERLDIVGRLLQYTRQMDMLMQSEASVNILAQNFLSGNYRLDPELIANTTSLSNM